MKKGFTLILVLFILILVGILPFFLPKHLEVSVEKSFSKPRSVIFDEIDNLNNYTQWSNLNGSDSAIDFRFFNPNKGVGAKASWESKFERIGKGTLRITESIVNEKVEIQVNVDGIDGNSINGYFLDGIGETNTKLFWIYKSPELSHFYRYLVYFIRGQVKSNMNKSLNRLSEKLKSVPDFVAEELLKPGEIQHISIDQQSVLGIRNRVKTQDIKTAIQESISTVHLYLFDELNMDPESIGFPTIFWISESDEESEFICGFPVPQSFQLEHSSGLELAQIPPSESVIGLHEGSRDSLFVMYDELENYIKQNQLKTKPEHWEVYIDNNDELKKKSQTKIYFPLEE